MTNTPLYFIASALFFLVSQGTNEHLFPGVVAILLFLIGIINAVSNANND